MELSVVIATRNKAQYLSQTLESIVWQKPPFNYEIIVVDDGSTDATQSVCERNFVNYIRLEKKQYTNPANAQNVGFKAAKGKVIVTQSDDVVHISPINETLERLYSL
jgi:glycosyltransferase involved in cell wall biosynthesis